MITLSILDRTLAKTSGKEELFDNMSFGYGFDMYDNEIDSNAIMREYYRIYTVTMESNMSISKRINLAKKLIIDLHTNHPNVVYTNIDDEIYKILKVLKRRIHRKRYR